MVRDPDIGPNGVVGSITRKDTKPSTISDNWLQQSSRRLQTQVVNDKGRYHSLTGGREQDALLGRNERSVVFGDISDASSAVLGGCLDVLDLATKTVDILD